MINENEYRNFVSGMPIELNVREDSVSIPDMKWMHLRRQPTMGEERHEMCWLPIVGYTTSAGQMKLSYHLTDTWIRGKWSQANDGSDIETMHNTKFSRTTIETLCSIIDDLQPHLPLMDLLSLPPNVGVGNSPAPIRLCNSQTVIRTFFVMVAPVFIKSMGDTTSTRMAVQMHHMFGIEKIDSDLFVNANDPVYPAKATPRLDYAWMEISGSLKSIGFDEGFTPHDPNCSFGLVVDAGCKIYSSDKARVSARSTTLLIKREGESIWSNMNMPVDDSATFCTHRSMQSLRVSLGAMKSDNGIPIPSNMSPNPVVEEGGRSSEWIDSWNDSRKSILHCVGAGNFHFHEFIRCGNCNGEVEIKSIREHIPPEVKCPHCNKGTINWGYRLTGEQSMTGDENNE